jgi:ribokinase
MEPLCISREIRRFDAAIGTGGVGYGMFFAINGMQTLGREESRSGRIQDRRDYCKLHIVSHYVKTLLGNDFEVIPIGRVGKDDAGEMLIREMEEAGLQLDYMKTCSGAQTLFSFCFNYPDGSGGNLSTDNSASSKLTPQDVTEALPQFKLYGRRGVGIALPEVPLDARATLLELAAENGLYRIASFTSSEMDEVKQRELFRSIDHLAVNVDEASMLVGKSVKETSYEKTVGAAVEVLAKINKRLTLSVTAGRDGSWVWDTEMLHHLPVPDVEVVSTAGAGDAFMAGLVAGITAGLKLPEAHQLATLVAALSVTSPHTISKEVDRKTLAQLIDKTSFSVGNNLRKLLSPPIEC